MYVPNHFTETRAAEITGIIQRFPFASIVYHTAAGLDANHIPLLFDADKGTHGILSGHIAKSNPMGHDLADGAEVLVIFKADDAYISPNWYLSKAAHHQHVPTWNYQVVHVHATIRFSDDKKFIRGVVGRLTKWHEQQAGEAKPWRMSDAPADYLDALLDEVLGFELTINRVLAKSKLGQNRTPADFDGLSDKLETRGCAAMAAAMRRLKPE